MAFTVNPLGIEGPPSDTRSFGNNSGSPKSFYFAFDGRDRLVKKGKLLVQFREPAHSPGWLRNRLDFFLVGG